MRHDERKHGHFKVGPDESGAGNNESAGWFEKSDLQFRISGMSPLFLSMYCLCSISLRQFQQIHHIDRADFQFGLMLAQNRNGGQGFQRGHIPATGHDHIGLNVNDSTDQRPCGQVIPASHR